MVAGEFEAARSSRTMIIAVAVIAIIGVSAVVIFISLPPAGNYITVLTRHDTAIQSAYADAFLATDYAKENGITEIKWKTQTAGYWAQVVEGGDVDVLWGGGPTLFDQMQELGYLLPLTSTLMNQVVGGVPDEIAGADMKRRNAQNEVIWVAAAISTFGFTVNHDFLDDNGLPVPNNWTHLAQPIWGSLLPTATIAMGNAPTTTSNTRIYEIITQGMGWDEGWRTMTRMAGSSNMYQSSVDTQAAVENRQVGVAMSIDFYGYATMARYPDCEYIIPEGESIVNGDPIAIAHNTEKQDYAEAFLEYVLSVEGQQVWFTEGVGRMPVLEEVFRSDFDTTLNITLMYEMFNLTKSNVGIDFNDTLSLLTNSAFILYFESVLNDAHDKLETTWTALVNAYLDEDINETVFEEFADQMGVPVTVEIGGTPHKFTLEYAIEINDQSQSFFNSIQILWTEAANAQYDQVLADLNALLTP
ncbi:MAG: ABC transporter substrate-binding protein [Promethearchaeota archaeon]